MIWQKSETWLNLSRSGMSYNKMLHRSIKNIEAQIPGGLLCILSGVFLPFTVITVTKDKFGY